MAKFLDKDPFSYEREKREFLHALRQYHATKGWVVCGSCFVHSLTYFHSFWPEFWSWALFSTDKSHVCFSFLLFRSVQPAMFRMPKVSGRDLDLYLLYSKVVALGGVVKVRKKRKNDQCFIAGERLCAVVCATCWCWNACWNCLTLTERELNWVKKFVNSWNRIKTVFSQVFNLALNKA